MIAMVSLYAAAKTKEISSQAMREQ